MDDQSSERLTNLTEHEAAIRAAMTSHDDPGESTKNSCRDQLMLNDV